MDILRNLFSSVTSGIIRLLVAAGILFAAYLLIVKPALETTEKISKEANSSFQKSLGNHGLGEVSKAIEDVNRQVQRQVRRSFHTAERGGSPKRLLRCVKHAEGDVEKIKRCTVKF